MNARTRMDESRQLAKWSRLISREVAKLKSNQFLNQSVGGIDDMIQVASLAVLQTIRSPKFKADGNQAGYLARAIRSRLIDAARDSPLIRVGTTAGRAVRIGRGSKDVANPEKASVQRAVLLGMSSYQNLDKMAGPKTAGEASRATARAMQDVAWAISRLPAGIGRIMGHLYGVAGHDKLSTDDTALRLGIKRSTVLRKAYEGRRLLRNLLRDCGYTGASDG